MVADSNAGSKTLGVAIVGCGRVSGGHARGWKQSERPVEIRALVDVAPHLAEKLKAAEHLDAARVLTEYREILSADDIDIVDICTYSDLHTEQIIACLEANKHVMTEKPVGYSLEDCRKLRWYRRKYPDPKVGVAYSLRYYPTNRAARKLLQDGAIGEVLYANVVHNHGGDLTRVRERRIGEHVHTDLGGRYIAGSEMTHITHPFDLARYLFGEVVDVFCYKQKYGTFATLRHEGDVLSQVIGASASKEGQSAPYVLCVQGSKGTLFTYNDFSKQAGEPGAYRGHVIADGKREEFTPSAADSTHGDVGRSRNFVDAILNDEPLICDMVDAIRTTELLHALRDSHDHEIRVPVHHADQTG